MILGRTINYRGLRNPVAAHRARRRSSPTQSLINTLFGNGEHGVFYVPKPVVDGQQVLFTDAAGTIPVTANSDPVGRMLDLSGNGSHATQSKSAARFLFFGSAGISRVANDGVDDRLTTGAYNATKTIMVLARRGDIGPLVVCHDSTTGNRFLFAARQNDSGEIDGNSGTVSSFVDGAAVYTRNDLHVATSDLDWHVLEARGVNTTGWADFSFGGYSDATFNNPWEMGAAIVFDDSDEESRDSARNYLAAIAGVTL